MSDTPETDSEHQARSMGGFTLDFCRQLERERDDAIEMMGRTRDNSGQIIASQAAENIILTQQRDRLANVLHNIRSGYGGQIPDPDCGCDDCAYLRPIDEALQSLKQTKKYDAKDHASFYP